jgi:hypothetical protein
MGINRRFRYGLPGSGFPPDRKPQLILAATVTTLIMVDVRLTLAFPVE